MSVVVVGFIVVHLVAAFPAMHCLFVDCYFGTVGVIHTHMFVSMSVHTHSPTAK